MSTFHSYGLCTGQEGHSADAAGESSPIERDRVGGIFWCTGLYNGTFIMWWKLSSQTEGDCSMAQGQVEELCTWEYLSWLKLIFCFYLFRKKKYESLS